MEGKKISILIVDDHPLVREGLFEILKKQENIEIVGLSKNGLEAVEFFKNYQPDIILMDIVMPEMDGIEATKEIRKIKSNAKIIMLTTFMDEEDIYKSFKAGAMAYLLKDQPTKEILDTIFAVYEGRKIIPPSIAEKLAEHLPSPELTPREMEILTLMVKGLSNKEISKKLNISEGTIKAHTNMIFIKLGVKSRTQAVILAVKKGLVDLK